MRAVLVANRGEIACRVFRSCRTLGLVPLAVYSDADATALHVQLADGAYHLGASKAAESYLNVAQILKAAHALGADAIHPGYGFLAENAEFARSVQQAGFTWVGPAPNSIAAMGDKARARELARSAGVPVLPGTHPFEVGALADLGVAAESVGYPLLIKASAGGGGIGMQTVHSSDDLLRVAAATQAMAQRSFGDGRIYLERLIARARHIEIQVFGLGNGRVIHLWERECSIQRRFQKIIEESPAPHLPDRLRATMADAAVALAKTVSYEGAGTVEFIVDVDAGEFYFLEMNTRIQVEHPVTEMITGVDLVALQLRLAAGADLSHLTEAVMETNGHAIECRLYAENPDRMFLPSPGTIRRLVFPVESEWLRIETGVREGDKVTPHYDPMIAKIIVKGPSRETALRRMTEALGAIELDGLTTNVRFLQRVIDSRAFQQGECFTGFVDVHRSELLGEAQSSGAIA